MMGKRSEWTTFISVNENNQNLYLENIPQIMIRKETSVSIFQFSVAYKRQCFMKKDIDVHSLIMQGVDGK